MAARALTIFSPAMLPLVSRTMPRLTGTRSALKCVTSTGRSSSWTMKSFSVSPGTKRPDRSVTVAVTLTKSTPVRKRKPSCARGVSTDATRVVAAAKATTAARRTVGSVRTLVVLRVGVRSGRGTAARVLPDAQVHLPAKPPAFRVSARRCRLRRAWERPLQGAPRRLAGPPKTSNRSGGLPAKICAIPAFCMDGRTLASGTVAVTLSWI